MEGRMTEAHKQKKGNVLGGKMQVKELYRTLKSHMAAILTSLSS